MQYELWTIFKTIYDLSSLFKRTQIVIYNGLRMTKYIANNTEIKIIQELYTTKYSIEALVAIPMTRCHRYIATNASIEYLAVYISWILISVL